MHRWTRLSSTSILDNRWLHVTADRCEIAPGKVVEPYYVVHEKEWVHVYATADDGRLLTVRQYRYAADVFCTELPGGAVDPGEDHQAAAARELLEETGHTAERWSYVGKLCANPARQTNSIHIHLAEGLSLVGKQQLDESEDIAWQFESPAAVEEAMMSGAFSQALHVASVYRAQQYLRLRSATSLQSQWP